MRFQAFTKLLNRKINSANKKAQGSYFDYKSGNPFGRPFYNTLVWVEPDDDYPQSFDKKG